MSNSPVGTIAYIIDEEALLVRVNKGWQYIAVSFYSLSLYVLLIINGYHFHLNVFPHYSWEP